jgi:Fur family ferric uptake transcriptional regulator
MVDLLPALDDLRPAGGKRSSKRDLILNVFLAQEGHLSADDLVELIHREDHRISRATVYRTLQWMIEAGIARKIDIGEGRFRFEHSYRHPRHFHLICKVCNRSSEFLSSDIDVLIEEIATARSFSAHQSVLQIYGTCEQCRTGRPPTVDGGTTELLFARDALRIAIATERSGLEFYVRAAKAARETRSRLLFERLADGERDHLAKLESRYQKLLATDPLLEARPTFLFFKGAANGLFAAGGDQVARGIADEQAVAIAIKCERASHRFFKRYGEKFEDSEGKRIFLEVAGEERSHLEMLLREYRTTSRRRPRRRRPPAAPRMRRAEA